ncbi:MAG: helix-hairpin-helix domain-containing protein [Bacteroidota bacterium]|nr:helix-hairpin-helix domain-containing protein [Bacteroidota bacterium]MDQ6888850.1 helix-hairpin-helix domain-containing protein [Bacteroidota bacterium]
MRSDFIKDYFYFTSKERKGVIIIVSIILITIFLPLAFTYFAKKAIHDHRDFEKEIAQLIIQQTDSSYKKNYTAGFRNYDANDYSKYERAANETIHAEGFNFDPNTASVNDWKRLGIKDKTIKTIQNYISKGGKFYKPEDIGKIWGLSPADAQRLMPYVSIKDRAGEYASFEKKEYPKTQPSYISKPKEPVDINLADTTAYIGLPGIGSKLSQRIIAFRDKLGGFYSVNQVGETFLLPDSTFQKIKTRLVINNINVKQININAASVDEMKLHPYMRYNIANAIFQYRQQHGSYKSVEEIKKIVLVSDEIFNKVAPYLSIE